MTSSTNLDHETVQKSMQVQYSAILDSMEKMRRDIEQLAKSHSNIADSMRSVLKEQLPHFETKWLINQGIIGTGIAGIAFGVISTDITRDVLSNYGDVISLLILLLCIVIYMTRLSPD